MQNKSLLYARTVNLNVQSVFNAVQQRAAGMTY